MNHTRGLLDCGSTFWITRQILLELESEIARTELQQAQAKLEGQLNRVTQLIAVKNQLEIAVRTQQQRSRCPRV